jgi:alkylation response protein AidB-like acyl-CoA dehydrogenase
MDFNYNPDDEAFRAEFRTWLKQNIDAATPLREALADEAAGDWEARIRWHRKLNEGGWVAINWPREYSGRGASILQNIIYQEELERAGTAAPFTGFGIPLLGPTRIHWGTEEQKRRFIPPILTAEEIWCQGYSEPNAGPTSPVCRPGRPKTATTSLLTALKSGPPPPIMQTGSSCWCAPTRRRPSTRASVICWLT